MNENVPPAAWEAVGWVLAGIWLLLWLIGRLLMPWRFLWWALVGLLFLICRALRLVCRAVGFVAVPLDELVTARLGIAPVLPRVRRWCRRVATEWRAHWSGAIEGEVMDGVWR